MGSGGPRLIVVNVGASNCDMSARSDSMSTEERKEKEIIYFSTHPEIAKSNLLGVLSTCTAD